MDKKEIAYTDMLLEQIKAQARYIDEVREVKHDMYAHMMVLNHYITKKDYDTAQAYLAKLMGASIFQNSHYIDVGNDVISALLSSKIYESKGKIDFSVSGVWSENLQMENEDICTLFSNLLSNSVEACEKLMEKEKRIEITFDELEGLASICVSNPVEWEIDVETFGQHTSKEDTSCHGYGMRNIRGIVHKYRGTMSVENEYGLVLVKVALPYIV